MFSLLSYHGIALEEYKGMSKKKGQPFRIKEILPHACHEAGHAVVGHVIGRLIEEVSIVPERARGYKGYCRFSAFMESVNDRFQWQEGSANPEIVTIFYAGTVATEIICHKHGWEYERVREGDQDDLDVIDQWCLETVTDKEERSVLKETCLAQARDILTHHWGAVETLASELVVHGKVPGGEAHLMIRQALGETRDDWRLETWGMKD
jgi:ATP-dependent Zn protease